MPEPIYTATTERAYLKLPKIYRDEDARMGWPLKTWVSGLFDQLYVVDTFIDRFTYTPDEDRRVNLALPPSARWADFVSTANDGTSDLTDPDTADEAWLNWLGQLVGVKLLEDFTLVQKRQAVKYASSGFSAGTQAAIANAASSVLTGSQYVIVYDHSDDGIGGIHTQGVWEMLIVTRASETPPGVDVIQAVIDRQAKPAGVKLYHRAYEASWTSLEASLPTWNAWEAAGTWQAIEETGL